MSDGGALPESNRESESAPAEYRPYAVLKNRNFLLYLVGRFIASFGQQMLAVTVGWEIYERTHSKLALGYVGLVQIVPMFLFIFPAGHVADNYSRKKIIVTMQLLYGLACAGLALVSFYQSPVIWMYCCLFVMGTARTYIWPASSAFLPQLVPRKQFATAVTWTSGSFQVPAVMGPVAGGIMVGMTHTAVAVYEFNAIASIICALLIGMVRAQTQEAVKERMSLRSIVAGLQFVYRTKVVLASITLDLFAVLLGGATAMLPVYAADILHVGATGLGWLQAALPLGSLLMTAILVHRPPLQKAGRTLLWAVAGFGLATIGFGFATVFWFAFLMLFICGMTDYVSVIVRHTLVQLLTPDEMRGRVSAVNSLFIGTSNQMGEFESGLVANYTSSVFAVVSGGIGTIVVVIAVALLWPEIRKYGRLDA